MRSAIALPMAGLLLFPSNAVAQPAPQEASTQTVVVGRLLQDYRNRLAACLARRCPTNEDIDASLALAEALLVAGEYRGARRALKPPVIDPDGTRPRTIADLGAKANSRSAPKRECGPDNRSRPALLVACERARHRRHWLLCLPSRDVPGHRAPWQGEQT